MVDADEPVRRRAGRVLLLDPDGRLLMLRGRDPARPEAGHWWFTVGGGCEPGESTAEAARREAWEEAGVRIDGLGAAVAHRETQFSFEGVVYLQSEDFYVARVASTAVNTDGWTEVERRTVSECRWWAIAELEATTEVLYPVGLLGLLSDLKRVPNA